MTRTVIALCAVVLLVAAVECGTPAQWRSRTVYQVLTDRFFPQNTNCNLKQYCGGSFNSIANNLDYIQGMGFDAIWISPIIENTDGGYHGYWAKNLYTLNSNFGTKSDLLNLINKCHKRGIWVMVDVVGNHVGPVDYDYSSITPFNKPEHYHDCNGCPSNCQIKDFGKQSEVEHCRLSGLPDLNHENPYVVSTLNSWIKDLVSNYSIDGLRIDTVPEVPQSFWSGFNKAAGVYCVGEAYDGRISYVSSYQNVMDGVLSYPLFFTLRDVFQNQQSMYKIESTLKDYSSSFKDLSLLGTFIDNHDQTRFLNGHNDQWLYRNAITYDLMATGIPIIYYGTEQAFAGGGDPYNREILTSSNANKTSDLYQYIKAVNNVRSSMKVWNFDQIQRYADDKFYAFSRGQTLVVLTNVGQYGETISRTITYHPYKDGQKLCNIFWSGDCLTVTNGSISVGLLHGEAKIYIPA